MTRNLLEWARHASPVEIEKRYGRGKHRLDQAVINYLWHHKNRDASTILGLLRVCLTSDRSQIMRDYEKYGNRRAEQRIRRMLVNAERSDARDAYEMLAQTRALNILAAQHLTIHARAVLSECIRRAVAARGAFTMSIRDAMAAATCTRYQATDIMHTLARRSYIVMQREHVKARQWARRWTLGDSITIHLGGEGGNNSDTASPIGGRGGSVRKVTTLLVTVDPEIASAVYAQVGVAAHDMHMVLCMFAEGATVSGFAKAANVARITARRWLNRLSEFTLAEKRGQLWHGVQPDLVKWGELYELVNGAAAKQRIENKVEDERRAFEMVAATMDQNELLDEAVGELMKTGRFRDRRAALRVVRSARLARQTQGSAHEHFERKQREAVPA